MHSAVICKALLGVSLLRPKLPNSLSQRFRYLLHVQEVEGWRQGVYSELMDTVCLEWQCCRRWKDRAANYLLQDRDTFRVAEILMREDWAFGYSQAQADSGGFRPATAQTLPRRVRDKAAAAGVLGGVWGSFEGGSHDGGFPRRFGDVPRRLPRPLLRRSRLTMASSICNRSAFSSAKILATSILLDPLAITSSIAPSPTRVNSSPQNRDCLQSALPPTIDSAVVKDINEFYTLLEILPLRSALLALLGSFLYRLRYSTPWT